MNKFAAAIALAALSLAPVAANAADRIDTGISAGKMLYSAEGKRLAPIYRVDRDGTVQVILNGKMVTVPGHTVSLAKGKIQTSLNKSQLANR